MVLVPNVVRKLNLLVDHDRFRNIDDLALALGRSRSTVYGWGDEKGGDSVPADRHDILVDLFFDALKQTRSREEIVQLLAAPSAFALEEELAALSVVPLKTLIAKQAQRGSGRLYFRRNSIGLVESEEQKTEPSDHRVKQGAWFRIEFDTTIDAASIVALQNNGYVWGLVTHAFHSQKGIIHLPGIVDGEAGFMRERKDDGQQLFIAMQTRAPLPPAIRNQTIDKSVLDGSLLNRLASHYKAQKPADRRLFAMTVDIVADAKTSDAGR